MQHFRRRCKHCGKSYTYCTYGNGPEYGTQKGCSMDYCAECQNAINDALAKIPIRIVKKYTLVDAKEVERISKIFEEEKEKYYSTPKLLNLKKMIPDWNCESVESCYIDRTEYYKCVEYDGIILYKVAVEYDVDELLDEYEELTDRAFKGGYEKCKSDIELNGFQLPEGYIFKDENGNVINARKIVLEKKKKE